MMDRIYLWEEDLSITTRRNDHA